MKPPFQAIGFIALAMFTIPTDLPAREPKADFDRVTLQHADGAIALSRACALGFRRLQAFFDASGVLFDPRAVKSQRGLYCHIFFHPTVAGFHAGAAPDPVASVVFDADSAEAYDWATGAAYDHSVGLIPVPQTAVAGSDWRGMFVAGRTGTQAVLLHARVPGALPPAPLPDKLPLREAVSALPWNAKDLLFVHDPRDSSRTIVLFGDRTRGAWKGLRDEEKAYLLRAEFGVDEARHLPTGPHWLSELLAPASLGSLNIARQVGPHDSARLRHHLAKLGFQTTHAEAPARPDHAIPLLWPHS